MRVKVKATGEIIDVAPVIRFIDGDAEWYAKKELVLLDGKEEIELATALVEKLQKKEKTMKARIKATGEIVEVEKTILRGGECYINTTGEKIGSIYMEYELDFGFDCDYNVDYWTRLEHQAAIAAMGGMCGNTSYDEAYWVDMAENAIRAAHALVEKMKEERK